jgi:hypothetical protein
MALTDLATPAARIHSALENLQVAWANVSAHWNDANSRSFEEEHLFPLAMTVKIALDAVGRMDETVHRAEQACLDERRSEVF